MQARNAGGRAPSDGGGAAPGQRSHERRPLLETPLLRLPCLLLLPPAPTPSPLQLLDRPCSLQRASMSRRLLWEALGLACLLAAASSAQASPAARRSLSQAAAAPASSPAAAPATPALAAESGACCTQLAAIGFTSNLPVVVLDTAGQPLVTKGLDVPIRMCTCNSGGWQCAGRHVAAAAATRAPWQLAGQRNSVQAVP